MEEERQELRVLVEKEQTQGYRIKHAQILLKLDELPENQEWTYDKIKEAYHATPHTIFQIPVLNRTPSRGQKKYKDFSQGGRPAALWQSEIRVVCCAGNPNFRFLLGAVHINAIVIK